ncbi:MAG: Na/Pi cotransporter family protein [Spirochaetaceae bacterium]|nr:Na/Pi cotransporter family protein [Spirochaetaceae bacterium]
MNAFSLVFQFLGGLGLLLFGMKQMSDGIQKSAGRRMNSVLHKITGNRFLAVLTGLFVTAIIQSSSATTVMVVSFVNAGILTLSQSVGVIFGANIGTTVTAWLVSIFGFKFSISALALPLFGVGFFLSSARKNKFQNIGETLMGFGLLFIGLDFLSSAIPQPSADDMVFLGQMMNMGFLSSIIGLVAGVVITVLIHSSSAATAIIISLAYNGILTFEFSAAMVLGSNIGTTIDVILVSIGAKVNARRAAAVHVFFNVVGSFIALIFFRPLLNLVYFLIPTGGPDSITLQVSLLHTIFNVCCTLLFLPFTKTITALMEKTILPKKGEIPDVYKFPFILARNKANAQAYLISAEKEISDMVEIASKMFESLKNSLVPTGTKLANTDGKTLEEIATHENYVDEMQEEISNYLLQCTEHLSLSEESRYNAFILMSIVDMVEDITDECYKSYILFKRANEKELEFDEADLQLLQPYSQLVWESMSIIHQNIGNKIGEQAMKAAADLENRINESRKELKKVAKKRLKAGSSVKAELLYIDVVRSFEKIGDRAFEISKQLFRRKD